MKILLKIFTITSLAMLAGCASDPSSVNANSGITETQNQNENTEVVVANTNDNSNAEANTNTVGTALELSENSTTEQRSEIDTSDWETYINDVYGFSLQYPANYSFIEWSVTDVRFSPGEKNGEFTLVVHNYDQAPEIDTKFYSNNTLDQLKIDFEADLETQLINGQRVKLYTGFENEEEGFIRVAEFFLDKNFIRITLPLSAHNPNIDSVETIKQDDQQIIDLFDAIVSTLQPMNKIITLKPVSEDVSVESQKTPVYRGQACYAFEGTDYTVSLQYIGDQLGNVSDLEEFINDPSIQDLRSQGKLMQLCISSIGDKIGFVIYGNFDDGNNNAVGMYRDKKVVTELHYNPNSGDIGPCTIDGFIEDVMMYSCGGGDGGGGWNKIYTIDFISAQSQLIKDCEFYLDDFTCTTNVLSITEHPQARYFLDKVE